MSRLSATSVDLDSLRHYCRIHRIDETVLDDRANRLVGDVAIPRLLELFDRTGTRATFFAIGRELAEPSTRKAVLAAATAGVEIASHSFSHDYALAFATADRIAADLRAADDAITELTRVRPTGFRAPGYSLTAPLLKALVAQGYRYDASVYPAAPYYAAKATVMAVMALRGRASRAVLDRPRVLLAPRLPYRPSLTEPYEPGRAPLVEIPMSVTPHVRLPFIGTFVTEMPWRLVEHALAALRYDSVISFELHAIDVLDESDGIPAALSARQRDARIPASEKLRRLERVLRSLRADAEARTVAEVANAVGTWLPAGAGA